MMSKNKQKNRARTPNRHEGMIFFALITTEGGFPHPLSYD